MSRIFKVPTGWNENSKTIITQYLMFSVEPSRYLGSWTLNLLEEQEKLIVLKEILPFFIEVMKETDSTILFCSDKEQYLWEMYGLNLPKNLDYCPSKQMQHISQSSFRKYGIAIISRENTTRLDYDDLIRNLYFHKIFYFIL